MEFTELYEKAKSVLNPRKISEFIEAGGVGAAILTENGNVYVGVCIDTVCSLGFCAEHAAVAAMLTAGEDKVCKVVAVNWDGVVLPPCGRCRELLSQLRPDLENTFVMVSKDTVVTLDKLLPYDSKPLFNN